MRRADLDDALTATLDSLPSNAVAFAGGWSGPRWDRWGDAPAAPAVAELPPEVLGFRLAVPYRSQLDNTAWAQSNCGPAALGMMLEYLGMNFSSEQLRGEAQNAQRMWGNSIGTLMEALATTAELHGAQVVGFRDGRSLRRWTTTDVRAEVEQGLPVLVQVHMRNVPGRQDWPRASDHYLVVVGLTDDGFIYHDPIDADGPGAFRSMPEAQLDRAMTAGDRRYSHTGFGVRFP
jgi:hypothetical protein